MSCGDSTATYARVLSMPDNHQSDGGMEHAHSEGAEHVQPSAHHSHGPKPQRSPGKGPDGGHDGHARPDADHGAGGHDKHAGHSVEMFREKFWGTLLLSIRTLVWAPMIQHWFGY